MYRAIKVLQPGSMHQEQPGPWWKRTWMCLTTRLSRSRPLTSAFDSALISKFRMNSHDLRGKRPCTLLRMRNSTIYSCAVAG